jgi:hypothetical protein
VLWREGSSPVLRKADGLGFELGADWREDVVGTNGVGTPAVVRRPVQVFAAEHFVRRVRRCLGGFLEHRPYRCREDAEVDIVLPDDPHAVPPHSTAPAVTMGRMSIHVS